jgi:hypothetical protein
MESRLKEISKLIYQEKKKIDLNKTEMMNLIANEVYGVSIIELYPSRKYINILKQVDKLTQNK